MRFQTLPEWLDWQQQLHSRTVDLDLERCRKVAERMGLLPTDFTVVSIAGTNGKGSCAGMLGDIYRRAGYRVGTYTSPHLLRYNERIRIDGLQADDALLCQSFARIDQARDEITLTYFEFGTLAAIDLFRHAGVDIAVMEVGLGGRLDAVNMLDADVSLISTIDLDHMEWLGSSREEIGREKAGIFRSMRPAVCADPSPPQSVAEVASMVGARYLQAGRDFRIEYSGSGWSWESDQQCHAGLPLPGKQRHQVANAAGVLMVVEALAARLPVTAECLFDSLRGFSLPGRFQVLPGAIPLVLDVAHNRQAVATLAAALAEQTVPGRTLAVTGMLGGKDHRALFAALSPRVDAWHLTALPDPRSAEVSDLERALRESDGAAAMQSHSTPGAALNAACAAAVPGDRILVTGSFLTVGEALRWHGRAGEETWNGA